MGLWILCFSLITFLGLSCAIRTTWIANIPIEPPPGQRCSGRNYNGRRCCTPDHPCGLGEGDCDGPQDGGGNDGHRGCKGSLVCGSNNCRKFGLYYHEKDDCCERAPEEVRQEIANFWGIKLSKK